MTISYDYSVVPRPNHRPVLDKPIERRHAAKALKVLRWLSSNITHEIIHLPQMARPCKNEAILFKNLRASFTQFCEFSSNSTSSSLIPQFSPLLFSKATSRKPDPPPTEAPKEAQKKTKYISHETAINLIKHERDPQHALEIFNMVSNQKGFNQNNATYSTILHKLALSKKFQAVDAIIFQMTYETCKFHENIFLNLMKHFSKSSLHERVLDMFHVIQPIVREKPSLKAFSTCLNLLVESDQVDLARNFLMHSVKKLNLRPNTCIFNILIKHHCRNGDLESAFEVVNEMKKFKISYPNLITYSTLINGLCERGRLKEAIELFEKMISEDHISPDVLTYNILIDGFCREGKVDQARKIMEFMKCNGCIPNIYNYTALMNGFCKEGRLEEVKQTFGVMKSCGLKPDTVGYTTLMNCLCRAGRIDEAIELLKEMKGQGGCKIDVVTYNVLFGGLCRSDRFKEALDMLERLPCEGTYLNKGSYRIVLNFLCQKGELKKATYLLGLMLGRGFVPHYATSNELLVRLCSAGIVDDAVSALFGLIEMGFKPGCDSWTVLVELVCRERKLLFAIELLDELINTDPSLNRRVSEATKTLNHWFEKRTDADTGNSSERDGIYNAFYSLIQS